MIQRFSDWLLPPEPWTVKDHLRLLVVAVLGVIPGWPLFWIFGKLVSHFNGGVSE